MLDSSIVKKCPPPFILCAILSILRIWISWLLGNVTPNNDVYDSLLMVEYANLFDHFWTPSSTSLVKDMSYPVFLALPSLVGISYNILLSFLWILAGIVCTIALKRVCSNRLFLTFAYLFIIWAPIAFEIWNGVRIYRNAIIAPSLFLFFGFLFLFFSNNLTKTKIQPSMVGISIMTGITFLFCYYIKEDGFWMLPMLWIVLIISIVGIFTLLHKKQLGMKYFVASLVITLLPLTIFQCGTLIYKEINNHYFGVSEINTRTEGELGKFVKNVYKVESPNRTSSIWTPYDAIEKVFDASETLQQYPELKDSVLNNYWFKKENYQDPIPGDFLGWVIRTSLDETGLWESEAQVQHLFSEVNKEIDAAFLNGTLKADEGISLSSSGGPRNPDEIIGLLDDTLLTFTSPIFFQGYRMDVKNFRQGGVEDSTETQQYIFNQYTTKLTDPGLIKLEKIKTSIGNAFSNIDFLIYRIITPIAFFVGIFGIIFSLISRITKRMKLTTNQCIAIFVSISLILMSIVYSFGICWFSEFIYEGNLETGSVYLTFYSAGNVPMVYFGILLGIAMLANILKARKSPLKKYSTSKDVLSCTSNVA